MSFMTEKQKSATKVCENYPLKPLKGGCPDQTRQGSLQFCREADVGKHYFLKFFIFWHFIFPLQLREQKQGHQYKLLYRLQAILQGLF